MTYKLQKQNRQSLLVPMYAASVPTVIIGSILSFDETKY